MANKICKICCFEGEDFLFVGNFCKPCNTVRIREYKKQWYQKNKDTILIDRKEYYDENKGDILVYQKNYRQENPDKIRERRQNYKPRKRVKDSEWQKNRRKNDPAFKLRQNVSHAIGKALKNVGGSKKGRSITKYLPYSFDELKIHIESQFEPWMNWANCGKYDPKTWDDNDPTTWKWQLDHIIAHSTFHYTSMEDQTFKDCWALSNLRPYSAKQNILDGNRRSA